MIPNDTASTGHTSCLARPDGRIGYDVAGPGPLIVLVPGIGDLRAGYRFLAPALRAAGYRVEPVPASRGPLPTAGSAGRRIIPGPVRIGESLSFQPPGICREDFGLREYFVH